MIIHQLHLCSRLDIWTPKYSDKYNDYEEWTALVACYKVNHCSPVIIINFPKAKHLAGQRFCIRRADLQRCKVGSNGKIPCYIVPMSQLETWETAPEARDLALSIFN